MSHSRETSSPVAHQRTANRDWRGLGDLIVLATERLTAPVEGMHHAIADRWFGLAGPTAVPIRRGYHALSAGIYDSVRMAGTAVGLGVTVAGERIGLRPLWRSPLGSGIQAGINALWGDELERRRSSLHIETGLRDTQGKPIGSDPRSLAQAFPEPAAHLVVLLHGLGETERCWQGRINGSVSTAGLGNVLAAEPLTPLPVRYNTGRHVFDSGAALAELLEEVTDGWPVPVESVALVGHSMGGLVARSSVHVGRAAGHRWADTTRHVVALGSPHLGAPLEKVTNLISWSLDLAPESRPLGQFLDYRSAGIKDLRFGAIREEDWHGSDPDALLRDIVCDTPPPEGVEQHFVAGVITADATHPVGVLVGDLVVRVGSATGSGRRRRVEATDVRVVAGRNHLNLLHDPAVHEQVRNWLATGSPSLLERPVGVGSSATTR